MSTHNIGFYEDLMIRDNFASFFIKTHVVGAH